MKGLEWDLNYVGYNGISIGLEWDYDTMISGTIPGKPTTFWFQWTGFQETMQETMAFTIPPRTPISHKLSLKVILGIIGYDWYVSFYPMDLNSF